ncbi:hypothetical protein [Mycobacterium haemophilum]|uniref:hypothetical protein n=1 Tax=Mycobacterium haemophilum TaxID=29311 RepID=UPI000AB7B35C|nr:hypothetical protein [Mycobacterium haemophilum]
MTGVLPDRLLSVVLGLDFGWLASIEAVHQPGRVVPGHHAEMMFSTQRGGQQTVAERRAIAYALSAINPNHILAQRVIENITDGSDR